MKRGQKGFGAIEGLLVIIIVLLIGFIGYYVYHTKNNTNSTYNNASKVSSSANQTANPYAGWKSYSDDLASFKYPGTWAAVRDDNTSLPGTKELELKGPDDSAIAKSTDVQPGDKASLVLTIFQNSPAGPACACKVYDVLDLNMSQLPNAKLVVASADPSAPAGDPAKPAQELDLTTDSNAKAGSDSLSQWITLNSKSYIIWADIADNDATGSRITDVKALENSPTLKDMTAIISSLQLK